MKKSSKRKCSKKAPMKKVDENRLLITKFIGALQEKEYKSANSVLSKIVEHKLRQRIRDVA